MKCEWLNNKNNIARFMGTYVPQGEQFNYTQSHTVPYSPVDMPDSFSHSHDYPQNNSHSTSDNQTQQKAPAEKDLAGSALGLGILQLISSGLQKLSQTCAHKLSAGKEFASASEVKKIAESMKAKNALDTAIEYISPENMSRIGSKYGVGDMLGEVAKGHNAFFMDAKKLAVAPESKPSLILHELGHAVNAKKPLTKFLQNSRRFAPYAPTAILLATQLVPDKKDGRPSFVKKYGGLLGFAAFLPTIIEEAIASVRGIKAAKGALGKSPAIKILTKNYGLALATYVISGIVLGVSTKMMQKEREMGIVRY